MSCSDVVPPYIFASCKDVQPRLRRLVVLNKPYKRLPRKKKKQVKKLMAQLRAIQLCYAAINAALTAIRPYIPTTFPTDGITHPLEPGEPILPLNHKTPLL